MSKLPIRKCPRCGTKLRMWKASVLWGAYIKHAASRVPKFYCPACHAGLVFLPRWWVFHLFFLVAWIVISALAIGSVLPMIAGAVLVELVFIALCPVHEDR